MRYNILNKDTAINIDNEISNILDKLEEEKNLIENKIKLISNLNVSGVDEKLWHELCETPFRESSLSLVVARELFPLGDNFKRCPNEVEFEMMGFNLSLPTSRSKGIIVDMRWYKPHCLEDFTVRPRYVKMRRYFELLDSGNYSWYDLAKCRCTREDFNKVQLFLWWFFKAKWRKVDRQKWMEAFDEDDKYNQKKVIERNNEKNVVLDKINKFKELVEIIKPFAEVKGYVSDPGGTYMTINIENYFDDK